MFAGVGVGDAFAQPDQRSASAQTQPRTQTPQQAQSPNASSRMRQAQPQARPSAFGAAPLAGDIDRDGDVDQADLQALLSRMGQRVHEGATSGATDAARRAADINHDNVVNASDLLALLANMGSRPRSSAAATTPSDCVDTQIIFYDSCKDSSGGGGGCTISLGADCDDGGGGGGGGDVRPPSGGGGGPPPPPDPTPDCTVTINGPNFVGVGAEVDYTATGSPPIDGSSNVVTFTASSTGASVVMNEQTDTTTFHTMFGLTPGDAQITVNMTTSDGASCSDTKQTTVLQYDEIRIKYRAYIPCEAVALPSPLVWLGLTPFYAGDNRTLSFSSQAYRAGFDVTLRVSDHVGQTGIVTLTSAGAPFGQTRAYDNTGAEFVAGVCNVALLSGAAPVATATLMKTADNHAVQLQ